MADESKVIKGLECCVNNSEKRVKNCKPCPYFNECSNLYNPMELKRDLLELVQRRKAVWKGWTKSYFKGREDDGEPIWGRCTYYICSSCGRRTVVADPFCPGCGASMEKEQIVGVLRTAGMTGVS